MRSWWLFFKVDVEANMLKLDVTTSAKEQYKQGNVVRAQSDLAAEDPCAPTLEYSSSSQERAQSCLRAEIAPDKPTLGVPLD